MSGKFSQRPNRQSKPAVCHKSEKAVDSQPPTPIPPAAAPTMITLLIQARHEIEDQGPYTIAQRITLETDGSIQYFLHEWTIEQTLIWCNFEYRSDERRYDLSAQMIAGNGFDHPTLTIADKVYEAGQPFRIIELSPRDPAVGWIEVTITA